jgi:hypothetical protein
MSYEEDREKISGHDWSTDEAWQEIRKGFDAFGGMADAGDEDDEPTGDILSARSFMREGKLREYDQHQWIIDGLLERKDKLIITGPSGRGKSTLIRQIAMCAAAGRNPFDPPAKAYDPSRIFEPKKTLLIDCENRESQTWRGMRQMFQRLMNQHGQEARESALDNMHIEVRESGIDLLNPALQRKLIERIGEVKPDIVCIGPLYYLSTGDPNLEPVAVQVAKTLRKITTEYDCALIVEAHSRKGAFNDKSGAGDPQGANLWTKWPDYGRSLFPADSDDPGLFHFKQFRGDREPRAEMPDYLRLDWASKGQPAPMMPWRWDPGPLER